MMAIISTRQSYATNLHNYEWLLHVQHIAEPECDMANTVLKTHESEKLAIQVNLLVRE